MGSVTRHDGQPPRSVRGRFDRGRWAAVGAALAVAIGSGGVLSASAAVSSGVRTVYVPITPCRVMDTRTAPQQVGPRGTALKADETYTITVIGTNGNCNIPAGAVGLNMNVAAVNPTEGSFLTVFPAGATRPKAANLNWVAGQPPVSNAVTAGVSADGKVSFYNLAGTVDLTADIGGYYIDHDFDDRYVRKPVGRSTLLVDPAAFSTDGFPNNATPPDHVHHDFANGLLDGGPASACAIAPVTLPQGATVTDVTAHVADNAIAVGGNQNDVKVKLWRNPIGVDGAEEMFSATTTGNPGDITLTSNSITGGTIDTTQFSYFATVCGMLPINFLYDMIIGYTNA